MLSDLAVRWFLVVSNLVLYALVGVRMAQGSRASNDPRREPLRPEVAATSASSRWARVILGLSFVPMFFHTGMVILAVIDRTLLGPLVVPVTLPLQLAGMVAVVAGLALITWAYLVFRSFRLVAEIKPGHELCSEGPFARLRHPIYTAVNLFYFGTFLLLPYVAFLIQAVANLIASDLRARVEEQVLLGAFGDQYRRYMARTKRNIPGLY